MDLDSRLAVRLAARLLPSTGMKHGRPTNRLSHWWYQLDGWMPKVLTPLNREVFKDPILGKVLVELRGNGCQTLVPPSFNDEIDELGKRVPGERLAWEMPLRKPSVQSLVDLSRAVRRLAAIALIGPYWQSGTRNDASLALSGWLLRGGLTEREVSDLLGALAFAVKADEKKVRSVVRDTARKAAAGSNITGATTLRDRFHFPVEVLSCAEDWLGIRGSMGGSRVSSTSEVPWPAPLAREAFPGVVGRIMEVIRPTSEADEAALLIHLLVMFGNAAGRKPYIKADGARHHTNLFAVVVGESSRARKGTAAGRIRELLKDADPLWEAKCNVSGLSSGEGLIWAVRDPITRLEATKTKGLPTTYEEVIADGGVEDKRLFVLETEFAQPLRVMRRDNNILSAVLRSAWDTGSLRTMTKGDPTRATDAHVSVLGHITRDELLRSLTTTDTSNGFANRFLWVCAKRSKLLPHGGRVDPIVMTPLIRELGESLVFAASASRTGWSIWSKRSWATVYPALGATQPGVLDVVTSRAEAQVLRLALVYALLDKSAFIRDSHLRSALAVWRYCFDSARHIFGSMTADPAATRILKAVRASASGLSRTAISDLFGGHKPATEISGALDELERTGKVRIVTARTGGRDEVRVVLA